MLIYYGGEQVSRFKTCSKCYEQFQSRQNKELSVCPACKEKEDSIEYIQEFDDDSPFYEDHYENNPDDFDSEDHLENSIYGDMWERE